LGHDRCSSRRLIASPAAHSAAFCSPPQQNLPCNAPSAASNSTPASNAHTSILPRDLSAPNPFRTAFHAKMHAIHARSIRSVCAWKSRLPRRVRLVPPMPGKHSKICSRNNPSLCGADTLVREQCSKASASGEAGSRWRTIAALASPT
jgi:hypothetical protein